MQPCFSQVGQDRCGELALVILHVGHDRQGAFVRRRIRCVDGNVVVDSNMNTLGLAARHPDVPVRPLSFALGSHLGLTAHADPDNGQLPERGPQSSLRLPTGEKHFINNDADVIAGPCDGRQTLVPGRTSPTELVPDHNGAVRREFERATRRRIGGAM